jgi:hypothetical protein
VSAVRAVSIVGAVRAMRMLFIRLLCAISDSAGSDRLDPLLSIIHQA